MQGMAELSELIKVAANGSGVAIFALYIVYKEILVPRREKQNGRTRPADWYANGISPLLMSRLDNVDKSLMRIEEASQEARDKASMALTKVEAIEERFRDHLLWDGRDRRQRL